MVHCKCFSWHQIETCFLENILSHKEFWLCCGSILFSASSELRLVKGVRLFEKSCFVKWVIFSASFLLALRLSAGKSDIKKTLMMSTGTFERMLGICMPEILFSKKEFQTEDFESLILYNFLPSVNHDDRHFYSAPSPLPTIKKLPGAL